MPTSNANPPEISISRAKSFSDTWPLLEEYFVAVQVVVRDTQETILDYLSDTNGGIWLAYYNGRPVGCIVLRPLALNPPIGQKTGEVKRLWVKPEFRGMGLASRLLSDLESHAASLGIQSLYLDSKDDLQAAIAFYARAGYSPCERYNDNPQATIFLRKDLTHAVTVRDFRDGDEQAFWYLNEAWISKFFKLEPKDIATLKNPKGYILSRGGRIYMACRRDERVGCCALLRIGDETLELAKMAFVESERGKGVGRILINHVIDDAKRMGVLKLYLETNKLLKNAIRLYESVGFRHLKPEETTPSPYARSDVSMELRLR